MKCQFLQMELFEKEGAELISCPTNPGVGIRIRLEECNCAIIKKKSILGHACGEDFKRVQCIFDKHQTHKERAFKSAVRSVSRRAETP